MTNPDLRHIAVVLDRSGSMHSVRSDTEGGLKAFLDAQREAPGQTTVSLYTFDDRYEVVYENKPLAEVPAFTLEPRGMTALLDAVGRTVTAVGEQLDAKPADERPGEVVVVILTDGHENKSREWTREQVKALTRRKEKEHGWTFVFLGADQDAFAAAGGIGIGESTTLSYSGTRTKAAVTNAGRMVSRGTATGVYAFTDDERDESDETT
ncbi:vWA domain-containing protein [Streptomyces synnematoformans]|uniref:VWA domain-containing protein n=1 Tax=Streptomyces synnematoformans TaxID=415721 RepID=A0ABN2XBN6_9ACTN